ncbi:protein kinase domain-containing protein [Streptomyces hydrogenans]|uniref:protein kinase domain-containing protein n=1 Tax=Streptomyces hydrogenans TaxID=1873719 RepID=UPI00278BCD24|nr:protein kinase [Streptomyces hydrogenans]
MSHDGAQGGRYAGGSVANGRYQLRDLLGEGGMASVYLAYDSALDRQVAIKTLHTELGREASFRERFRREAQAVAKLSHTNIVSVFDTGEDTLDGGMMPYIVMEYVEGQPLGSVLASDVHQYGAMPADKALKVTADVLAALEVSHEMGLVHRDIKPGNVMMTKRGVVKVMDFGIARAMQSGVTSMTQTGMVVGTPQYLSPEQALGRPVDARSDLYSVGIMLFQLLTGRLPFDADSPLAIAYAHVQEEPVAPSSVNRSVSPAMDALVARALRKNPNERFPSAAAMRDECLRVLSAGQSAAPVIVPGAPLSSGSGVGSAVFPPVGQTPPPHQPAPHVQQPYQPPTPQPGPYGPPTPAPAPMPGPAYGYPQQAPTPAPGYATPPVSYAPAPTPAPVAPAPRRNTPMIVGAALVVLIALGGVLIALKPWEKEQDPTAGGTGGVTGSQTGGQTGGTEQTETDSPGHKGPDLSKTIDIKKCTEPRESSDDPDKFEVPDFTYKNLSSVKDCVRAAGWKIKKQNPTDENTYGEDTILGQYPPAGEDISAKDAEFTLEISTGNPQK